MKTNTVPLPETKPGVWAVRAGARLYLVVNVAAGTITAWGRDGCKPDEGADQELGVVSASAPGNSKTGGVEHMASLVSAATDTARATWPDLVKAEWWDE